MTDGDALYGGLGCDLIKGGAGGDLLSGDAGHDTILGGAGDDRIGGGDGPDTLVGGAGDDFFACAPGAHDVIDGGDGVDLFGWHDDNTGTVVCDLSLADPTRVGNEGDDRLNGGGGADSL